MITFLIVLLTAALVADCLILILLVMVQLPKKEAGAGMAFGGGATDALFGAGSGTVLTKITKWSAVAFFCLAFVLSILNSKTHNPADREAAFERQIKQAQQEQAQKAANEAPAPVPAPVTPASNAPIAVPLLTATNIAPTATPSAATNAPAAPAVK